MAGIKLLRLSIIGLVFIVMGCIPIGLTPTPRMLRKQPELRNKDLRPMYPDSLLPRAHLLEFPYRQIREIRLSWKVVAGLKLKYKEVKLLRELILKNVKSYWQYRFPNQEITHLLLDNVSVADAQILISQGYPLLLYSAYDIKHRHRHFTFEGYDVCVGYRGITSPRDKRVSFKLNSGLRGYIDSKAMLTGTILDIPRLKNSKVQVLQVVLFTPPGMSLEDFYALLHKKYKELGETRYTLPVVDESYPMGSIR